MRSKNLTSFWLKYKKKIGIALSASEDDLAAILNKGARQFDLLQENRYGHLLWKTREGEIAASFSVLPDPRDLDRVLDWCKHVRNSNPSLAAVFVHQWTDGEHNWDVFTITESHGLRHSDRIWGSEQVIERGPDIRGDTYELFSCAEDFPPPGQTDWSRLLAGPRSKVDEQLNRLSKDYNCSQSVRGQTVHWTDSSGKTEVLFIFQPEPASIEVLTNIYEQIQETGCPICFLFAEGDNVGVYDIFRLSTRSYLEHHNQAKIETSRTYRQEPGERKGLHGLRWSPRWTSHVGCIRGCLDYLGIEVSDGWLYGASGHAFVLNITPDLCPSGPTDWDTRPFQKLGRNIGYSLEGLEEWCPEQDSDLAVAQKKAWNFVRNSLDEGFPCYGWELLIPEFYVIYDYDREGYYVSGPDCDEGKGPIRWQKLGKSGIGAVIVSSVRPTPPEEDIPTVLAALEYALDLGRKETRVVLPRDSSTLNNYSIWIEAMQNEAADQFGLAYNAAVWAENRKYAVEFLREARERLGPEAQQQLTEAENQYAIVAESLATVSKAYPFSKETKANRVRFDARAKKVVEALKKARQAEKAGLDRLAEAAKVLGEVLVVSA